jgi:hypothetical protein
VLKIMSRFRFTPFVCLFALGISTALAQTGAIQGTLSDAAGATVPNAKVTAIDQDKGSVEPKRRAAWQTPMRLSFVGRSSRIAPDVPVRLALFEHVEQADDVHP